jgi:hypothetical protein
VTTVLDARAFHGDFAQGAVAFGVDCVDGQDGASRTGYRGGDLAQYAAGTARKLDPEGERELC